MSSIVTGHMTLYGALVILETRSISEFQNYYFHIKQSKLKLLKYILVCNTVLGTQRSSLQSLHMSWNEGSIVSQISVTIHIFDTFILVPYQISFIHTFCDEFRLCHIFSLRAPHNVVFILVLPVISFPFWVEISPERMEVSMVLTSLTSETWPVTWRVWGLVRRPHHWVSCEYMKSEMCKHFSVSPFRPRLEPPRFPQLLDYVMCACLHPPVGLWTLEDTHQDPVGGQCRTGCIHSVIPVKISRFYGKG